MLFRLPFVLALEAGAAVAVETQTVRIAPNEQGPNQLGSLFTTPQV